MAAPIVIDANIFKSYYEVFVNGSHSLLTDCPTKIFNQLGFHNKYIGYLDEDGKVKREWEDLVDRQWFEVWFAEKLILAHFDFVSPSRDRSLEARLAANGFPRGRDLVYVRVSQQIVNQQKQCTLISEDLDFYSPTQKGCPAKTRNKILISSSGNVAKSLRKNGIDVKCVATA